MKKKNVISVLVLPLMLSLVGVLPINAQNKESEKKAKTEYPVATEKRSISPFQRIDISGRFAVKLYPSASPEVTVIAAEKYIQSVETNVNSGILKINMLDMIGSENVNVIDGLKTKYNDYLIRQPIEIQIGVTNISHLFITGVTTVDTESLLKLQNLNITIGDASKANLNVEISHEFTVSVSGAAKVEITGKAANSQVTVSGASAFDGKDFLTKSTKVNLSGASRAEVYATESIDAELKGATKLVCTGSPKNIKQNASRGSSVIVK